MKKTLLTIALCVLTFGLGAGFNAIAFSAATQIKIGYVDVPKLLKASKVLKAAEDEKVKQTTEMLKWYDTASVDIQKQQTKQGRDALIKKYEAQLTGKKNAIKDAYAKKVTIVDNQLNQVITSKAKAMGYTIVLRKDSVLYGGTDITAQILPSVK